MRALPVLVVAWSLVAPAAAGAATEIVSSDATGRPGLRFSYDPSMSDDGRYVAFTTEAPNIAGAPPGYENAVAPTATVKDRRTGAVATMTDGPAGESSGRPALSGDGRHVAYVRGPIFG